MTRRYVHGAGADVPLISYAGAGLTMPSYLHANHQGSIVSLSNAAGTVTAINRYDEYGIPAATNSGRFQYTGQIWLPDLGMYHYKAKVYSPTLGRFLQVDPIGYDDQFNLYAYVENDPVNLVDSTGTQISVFRQLLPVILVPGAPPMRAPTPERAAQDIRDALNLIVCGASGVCGPALEHIVRSEASSDETNADEREEGAQEQDEGCFIVCQEKGLLRVANILGERATKRRGPEIGLMVEIVAAHLRSRAIRGGTAKLDEIRNSERSIVGGEFVN